MSGALITAGDAATAGLRQLVVLAAHGTALVVATALLVLGLEALGRWRQRGPAPAFVAALWTVALIKFVLPVGPALRWSLSDLLTRAPSTSATPSPLTIDVAAPATAPVPAGPGVLAALLAVAALVAVATLALVATRRLVRLARAHHVAMNTAARWPLAPAPARADLAQLAHAVGVRPPTMRVAPTGSPYVVGLWRATLVVPAALLAGPADLRHAALVHELAHVRRRDPAQQLVVAIIGALFWWCPPVAWAARRLDAAREAACDAWALEVTRVDVGRYARMLVHHARAPRAGLATAAFLGAPRPAVAHRVGGLLRGVGPARLGPWRLALLAPWALVALAGARAAAAPAAEPALVCVFTPEIAESLLAAYPEADGDGDGELSRGEACEFEAELRRRELLDDAGLAAATTSDELVSASTEDDGPEPVAPATLQLASARALLEDSTACCKCRADGGNSPDAIGATSTSTRCSASFPDRRSEGVSP